MTKIFMGGDIVGRAGRTAFFEALAHIRRTHEPDWIVVNGENAASGFGITESIAKELFDHGVDAITTGNHVWDQKNIVSYIAQEPRLLRPLNFPPQTPGYGSVILEKPGMKRLMVANVMARLFMEPFLDDPFRAFESVLQKTPLRDASMGGIVVDIHGETTSEKAVFAHYFDGRVSAVVGTHTHVPTADARILPKGTAFQTDLGMIGDYDSVIGMEKETAIPKMIKKGPSERLKPALGAATVCGALITLDDKGLAVDIRSLIMGPHLHNRP